MHNKSLPYLAQFHPFLSLLSDSKTMNLPILVDSHLTSLVGSLRATHVHRSALIHDQSNPKRCGGGGLVHETIYYGRSQMGGKF